VYNNNNKKNKEISELALKVYKDVRTDLATQKIDISKIRANWRGQYPNSNYLSGRDSILKVKDDLGVPRSADQS
jgi:hypothetical protein